MNILKESQESAVELAEVLAVMQGQKSDSLATHASLLERLKDLEDQGSWQEFYSTYRKLIFSFALKHGLTPTEAEDVVQETVITVARNLPEFKYDPKQCSFKTWMFNLTLWRIQDQLRKRHPQDASIHRKPGETDRTSTVERIPDIAGKGLATLWEEEWKKDLFERALGRVKAEVEEKPFQIFDLYAIQGWPAREVARSLGVSLARVYVTRHRISLLLKKEIQVLSRKREGE
ncbi:MAG TPA: sigma-70 family RNA polymerase sigma factor [Candidatus Paceibacterota bacterium]|nr:sigma-70 family RNA polymerase sigma factor [Verrucomicrobiota bacterium]HRY48821.1 sigma-70 family RNA polymerase sigma factor [Candidatus Paceibacterota bacterium]HRZ99830.1 sigma-70 family RNA polymerase sigma factor [Candidatus Paceibacterota bacterium]